MLVVIDSGVANLRSVVNALHHLGAQPHIARTPADLDGASRIILPGVGAFEAGMAKLRKGGYVEPIRAAVARGIPLLGICLGMQMLFEASEEMGEHEGLGLIPGRVVRFPAGALKVPHMGWNQLQHVPGRAQSPLLDGIPSGGYAYFVHSYYADTPSEYALSCCDYGLDFPAVVERNHVYGAQFHPEKSQGTGLRLLTNFLSL
jgi:glutamine amidotransferase